MNTDTLKQNLITEFQTLEKQLTNPMVIRDTNTLQQISQRHAELTPIVSEIINEQRYNKEIKELETMITSEKDSSMTEFYKDEVSKLKDLLELSEQNLGILLRPSDPNDKRNAIIEIRAGTGGEEAALFAADLFRMYTRFAEGKGWKVQILHSNETGNGGFKEIVLRINARNVYGTLKLESGVHRVQRVPATESAGRIHTSAASVVVLPEVDDLPDIQINDSDIKIDVYRATGPGGQSVNTTDSAVRITHLATGIVVTCQDEKSQLKNKARALSVLKSKLYQMEQEKIASQTDSQRKAAIQTGDRSAKIRTYNFPQSRVTDHRIKTSWHNLEGILNGNLEEILIQTSAKLQNEIDI